VRLQMGQCSCFGSQRVTSRSDAVTAQNCGNNSKVQDILWIASVLLVSGRQICTTIPHIRRAPFVEGSIDRR